ncbi:hypothetical protein QO058_26190 [Bosea vestrisii]|uniref:hypothetical protein n=1 Tax=Bosea vestrisii TaxID=151416 RepID=UPI0024DF52CD|nr:hypothetical protein [Bosea vestrisii]WID96182.1 hypothetical protein QO058_26190 [Bosea vestrisii]
MRYNFLRIHETLRITGHHRLAMAANLSGTLSNWTDIVEVMDAAVPAKARAYKKAQAQISI